MLEGDLGDFSLPDILKLLAFTSKSGRLTIATTASRGRIDLVEGRVRQASADAERLAIARRLIGRGLLDAATLRELLSGRSDLPTDLEFARDLVAGGRLPLGVAEEVLREQTVDAVFDLFRWPEGSFSFAARPQPPTPEATPELAITVDDLVADVQGRLEAWDKILERSGAADDAVLLARPGDAASDVDAEGWQLVGLVDGRRTVAELAHLSGRGEYATRQTLAELIDRGVVALAGADEDGRDSGVGRLLADQALLSVLENDLRPRTPSRGPEPPAAEPPAATGEPDVQETTPGTSGGDDPAAAPVEQPQPPSTPPEQQQAVDWGDAVRPSERLRPDPGITEDLLQRLIEGVERI